MRLQKINIDHYNERLIQNEKATVVKNGPPLTAFSSSKFQPGGFANRGNV